MAISVNSDVNAVSVSWRGIHIRKRCIASKGAGTKVECHADQTDFSTFFRPCDDESHSYQVLLPRRHGQTRGYRSHFVDAMPHQKRIPFIMRWMLLE